MFFQYINERKSWILYFIFTVLLTDFIIWIDAGIQLELDAFLYLNVVIISLFILFLIWRYFVETAYIKELALLEKQESIVDVQLPTYSFPSEQVIDGVIRKVMTDYEMNLQTMKDHHLIETDYTTAWVHEVKAPLTAMKMTIDENRHNPAIRKIDAEWLRIHLLIDQQLSIARLSSHETDYLLEKTSVQDMLFAEVKELAAWCFEKQIAIEFEGDELEVVTDEKWCRFIFRQALTNAVKYSPVGSTVTIMLEESESGNVHVSIQDEGPGVEPHELPRIFEKGFTGDAGRIHNAATGLGLYLAKTVAERIGVTLAAQSEIGQGMSISFTFPLDNEFNLMLK